MPPGDYAACPVVDTGADLGRLTGYRRVVVVGSHADLATVLTWMLRADRLDIEVAATWQRGHPWQARRSPGGPPGTAARPRAAHPRRDRDRRRPGGLLAAAGGAARSDGEAVVDDSCCSTAR